MKVSICENCGNGVASYESECQVCGKNEVKFLLEKLARYRNFIEQIAGRVYDSPYIPHEEIVSDAQEILSSELKNI